MKNTFWHFGDSFAFSGNNPESFGLLLSRKFNMNYQFLAVSGSSNPIIFSSILETDFRYKPGDVIFINWSFFHRGWYVDDNHTIKSTNHFFNENNNKVMTNTNEYDIFIKKNSFILDYTLNYSYDSNIKLFNGMVYPYFESLKQREVTPYNLFIRNSESVSHGDYSIDNLMDILKIDNNVEFELSYFDWLVDNEYMNSGDEGHYTNGIQPILADEIYKRIQNKFG